MRYSEINREALFEGKDDYFMVFNLKEGEHFKPNKPIYLYFGNEKHEVIVDSVGMKLPDDVRDRFVKYFKETKDVQFKVDY